MCFTKKALFFLALVSIIACQEPSNPLTGLERGLWLPDTTNYRSILRADRDFPDSISTFNAPSFVLSDSANELIDQGHHPFISRPSYNKNNDWELGYHTLLERKEDMFAIVFQQPDDTKRVVNYHQVLTATENPLKMEDLIGTTWELSPPIYGMEKVLFAEKNLSNKGKQLVGKYIPIGVDSTAYEALHSFDNMFVDNLFLGFNGKVEKHSRVTFLTLGVLLEKGKFALVAQKEDTLQTIVVSTPYLGQVCTWTKVDRVPAK